MRGAGREISRPDIDASDWVNGNLGASKAVYFEGDSIPYRMLFDNLTPGSSHAVTIEWDTTKSSKHALPNKIPPSSWSKVLDLTRVAP